jgi:hypothetical protein
MPQLLVEPQPTYSATVGRTRSGAAVPPRHDGPCAVGAADPHRVHRHELWLRAARRVGEKGAEHLRACGYVRVAYSTAHTEPVAPRARLIANARREAAGSARAESPALTCIYAEELIPRGSRRPTPRRGAPPGAVARPGDGVARAHERIAADGDRGYEHQRELRSPAGNRPPSASAIAAPTVAPNSVRSSNELTGGRDSSMRGDTPAPSTPARSMDAGRLVSRAPSERRRPRLPRGPRVSPARLGFAGRIVGP